MTECGNLKVAPHAARKRRYSAVRPATEASAGYRQSQVKRKRIEEVFGWMKTVELMHKTRHRGRERMDWMFVFAAAAYNLVRMRKLMAATA